MMSKTDKIILYLVRKSKQIDRLKLMKLMFLAEYYNFEAKKIEPYKNIGNDFIIYSYGVFSFEVYTELFTLLGKEMLEENKKLLTTQENVVLDSEIKVRADKILEKFGSKTGWELANLTLDMLKIKKEEKYKYNGVPVETILINMS